MSLRAFVRACSALALGVVLVAAAPPRKQYLAQHKAATRELRVRWHFSSALILRATLLTESVRRQLAAERDRLVAPPEDEGSAWLDRSLQEAEQVYEVVFAADSGIDDADDFGNPDTGWGLTLLADGVEQPLVDVRRIRRPTPLQHALFPQLNIWSELWVARFERVTPAKRDVLLRVGSGYGHGEVRWELSETR